jgi:hypothetical protein
VYSRPHLNKESNKIAIWLSALRIGRALPPRNITCLLLVLISVRG